MSIASEAQIRRKRDAVRILHILHAAGRPVKGPYHPPDAIKVIEAEKRLQALDFWVRNPDYLAYELLNQYEQSGDKALLNLAAEVMSGDEPDLRRLGMLRFFFGAFERVHDAVANLKMLGLVEVIPRLKGDPPRLDRRDYYLLKAGAAKADELAQDEVLKWYAERAALVAFVAGNRTGAKLKSAQYGVEQYEDTRWGEIIAPISDEVRARLARLLEAAS